MKNTADNSGHHPVGGGKRRAAEWEVREVTGTNERPSVPWG